MKKLVLIMILFYFPVLKTAGNDNISLPSVQIENGNTLENALNGRRSTRSFGKEPVSLAEISRLLWAAQGITDKNSGRRTAPSAGALYPLEIYVLAGQPADLAPGIYHYNNSNHSLKLIKNSDLRKELCVSAYNQSSIIEAPVIIIITAVFNRTKAKYRERGAAYAYIETGHSAQNILLEAFSLGLSSVTIGAFREDPVKKIMGINKEETPVYIIPVGKGL